MSGSWTEEETFIIPMDFPRSRYFSNELDLPGTSQAWPAGLPGKVQAPLGEHMSEKENANRGPLC